MRSTTEVLGLLCSENEDYPPPVVSLRSNGRENGLSSRRLSSAHSQPRRRLLIHRVVLAQPHQLVRRAEELNDDPIVALGAFQRDVAGDNVGQDCQSRSFATGSHDAHSRHHPLRFSLDGVETRFQIREPIPRCRPRFCRMSKSVLIQLAHATLGLESASSRPSRRPT
jgi:hypothetical protein